MEHAKNILNDGPVNDPTIITPEGYEINDPVSLTQIEGDETLEKVRRMRNPQAFLSYFMDGVEETEDEALDFEMEDEFHDPRFDESPYMETEFPEKRVKEVIKDVQESKKSAPAKQERSDKPVEDGDKSDEKADE